VTKAVVVHSMNNNRYSKSKNAGQAARVTEKNQCKFHFYKATPFFQNRSTDSTHGKRAFEVKAEAKGQQHRLVDHAPFWFTTYLSTTCPTLFPPPYHSEPKRKRKEYQEEKRTIDASQMCRPAREKNKEMQVLR